MHPIPGGSVMGVPTEIGPFIKSGLFSLGGKTRATGDFVLPRFSIQGDQSLGAFFVGVLVEKLLKTSLNRCCQAFMQAILII